jgi:integrase/recombinase XerD
VRDTAIIYFLLDTGVRASELCQLRLVDYEAQEGTWRVRGAKTGHPRAGRLSPPARRAVGRWLANYRGRYGEEPDTVFVGLANGQVTRLTPNGLTQLLRRLGRAAGITDRRVSAHTFRHTFALWYLLDGGDPATLQMLLGHAGLWMTMRYLHVSEEQLAMVQQKHSPAARVDAAAVARYRRQAGKEKR